METKVKNIIVTEETGLMVIYCLTLTFDEIRAWCEKCGACPVDIYEEKQENLQYLCIDGRVWCDTPEKEETIRRLIA